MFVMEHDDRNMIACEGTERELAEGVWVGMVGTAWNGLPTGISVAHRSSA